MPPAHPDSPFFWFRAEPGSKKMKYQLKNPINQLVASQILPKFDSNGGAHFLNKQQIQEVSKLSNLPHAYGLSSNIVKNQSLR